MCRDVLGISGKSYDFFYVYNLYSFNNGNPIKLLPVFFHFRFPVLFIFPLVTAMRCYTYNMYLLKIYEIFKNVLIHFLEQHRFHELTRQFPPCARLLAKRRGEISQINMFNPSL